MQETLTHGLKDGKKIIIYNLKSKSVEARKNRIYKKIICKRSTKMQ